MKLTKRILCLALVLALSFALCACGNKDKKEEKKSDINDSPSSSAPITNAPNNNNDWAADLDDGSFNDATLAW